MPFLFAKTIVLEVPKIFSKLILVCLLLVFFPVVAGGAALVYATGLTAASVTPIVTGGLALLGIGQFTFTMRPTVLRSSINL